MIWLRFRGILCLERFLQAISHPESGVGLRGGARAAQVRRNMYSRSIEGFPSISVDFQILTNGLITYIQSREREMLAPSGTFLDTRVPGGSGPKAESHNMAPEGYSGNFHTVLQ